MNKSKLQSYQRFLRNAAGMALRDPVKAAKYAVSRAEEYRRKRYGTALETAVNAVDNAGGHKVGSAMFMGSPRASGKSWEAIEDRLFKLARSQPEAIPDFVTRVFETSSDPIVIARLAYSDLSRDALRNVLLDQSLTPDGPFFEKIQKSQLRASGINVAATLLLDDEKSQSFSDLSFNSNPTPNLQLMAVMNSFGYRPSQTAFSQVRAGFSHTRFRKPADHRLIITDSLNAKMLSLYFSGADRVTVLPTSDLYGRLNFETSQTHSPNTVVSVEHARSRITRFSEIYHRIHEETRSASETIVKTLLDNGGMKVIGDSRPYLELALADQLFFASLKREAISHLFNDSDFDHIVIAIEDPKTSSLLSMLGEKFIDPRLEIVSLSSSLKERISFPDVIAGITSPPQPKLSLLRPTIPASAAARELSRATSNYVSKLATWPRSETQAENPRVLLVTTQVSAYNSSSREFHRIISENFDARMAFVSGNIVDFAGGVSNVPKSLSQSGIISFPKKMISKFSILRSWLEQCLDNATPLVESDIVRHVLISSKSDVLQNGLLSYISFVGICRAWAKRIKRRDEKPDIVAITPFRPPRAAYFAEFAHRLGVPSIALEPHGLNGSYCRYNKISSDYYGVISSFFRDVAQKDFGISADRALVVGSPRLVADKDYDLQETTQNTREMLETEGQPVNPAKRAFVVTYLSQPSNWDQISQVWEIILNAVKGLDCQLVLKMHPEETDSRLRAYVQMANECLGEGSLVISTRNAKEAIEASDLVLSGYSATVLEATLLHRPVFCITNGDTKYPLAQHEIVGAPLLGDTESLRRKILEFFEDPDRFRDHVSGFLEGEQQFLSGPENSLPLIINDILKRPPSDSIRPGNERPKSLFLDGPHEVFDV